MKAVECNQIDIDNTVKLRNELLIALTNHKAADEHTSQLLKQSISLIDSVLYPEVSLEPVKTEADTGASPVNEKPWDVFNDFH